MLLFLASAMVCEVISDTDADVEMAAQAQMKAFMDLLTPNALFYFESSKDVFASGKTERILRLFNDLQSLTQSTSVSPEDRIGYLRILNLYQPRHVPTLLLLGESLTSIHPPEAMHYYEMCFDPTIAGDGKTLVNLNPRAAFMVANLLGRYFVNEKNYLKAFKYTKIAFETSKRDVTLPPELGGRDEGDTCSLLMLATMLDDFPTSLEAADESVKTLNNYADVYLNQRERVLINDEMTTQVLPYSYPDPYIHCALTLFPLSFYYREDVAAIASQHYNIVTRAWPKLKEYRAPHVLEMERKDTTCDEGAVGDRQKRIKLGVLSGALKSGHSVSEDFGGVLSRLSRDIFKVTYVFIHEHGNDPIDPIFEEHTVEVNGGDDEVIHLYMSEEDKGKGAWPLRHAEEMGSLQFDIALYLDLTMSRTTRRIGMSRIAPVQINTHGETYLIVFFSVKRTKNLLAL